MTLNYQKMGEEQKVCLSDLILAAVCTLQEKNGVGACEIIEYVANKRGCKVEQVEGTIRMVLCHAKLCDIFTEKKGCYRINERYDDISDCTPYSHDPACRKKFRGKKKKNYCCAEDDNEDEDLNNLCACLKLSRKHLKDDEDEQRCPHKKKYKS